MFRSAGWVGANMQFETLQYYSIYLHVDMLPQASDLGYLFKHICVRISLSCLLPILAQDTVILSLFPSLP